jgi:hypothetical protein
LAEIGEELNFMVEERKKERKKCIFILVEWSIASSFGGGKYIHLASVVRRANIA